MLNMLELWTGGLTIFVALIGYIMHEKFNELKRIDILLNKTREEVARDNVTGETSKKQDEKIKALEAEVAAGKKTQQQAQAEIGMKKGGKVSSASKRADGCAVKGKTKGRMV